MKKVEQLYEGKAKKVFSTEDPNYCIVSYKDDATAFNGQKKGTILGKGAINNRLTNYFMKLLEEKGVPTHFVEELSDTRRRSQEGQDRPSGGHHPQHLRRQLCRPLRRGGGHRI